MKVTGVVLAGGKSERMGQNKALMLYKGRPLIQYILERLSTFTDQQMIIGEPSIYEQFGVPVYEDRYHGKGPLAGLHSALINSETDLNLVVGCDMPNIDRSVLDHLAKHVDEEYDAYVPIHNGMMEPLFAIYHKRCSASFAQSLEKDVLKLSEAFKSVRVKFVQVGPRTEIDDLEVFKNINGPKDI